MMSSNHQDSSVCRSVGCLFFLAGLYKNAAERILIEQPQLQKQICGLFQHFWPQNRWSYNLYASSDYWLSILLAGFRKMLLDWFEQKLVGGFRIVQLSSAKFNVIAVHHFIWVSNFFSHNLSTSLSQNTLNEQNNEHKMYSIRLLLGFYVCIMHIFWRDHGVFFWMRMHSSLRGSGKKDLSAFSLKNEYLKSLFYVIVNV